MRIKTPLALLVTAVCTLASAQEYPNRVITFVVPAPPGGATDAIARTLADEMGKRLKQTIIVDNKPGANGTIGAAAVAHAKPDGYTVLMSHAAPVAYAPYMFSKMSYDARRDLAPITELCSSSLVYAVPSALPVKTMKDFVGWAEKNRGKVNYGSFGIGSSSHLLNAYLNESHRLDMNHVAYKGEAPMTQDMMGNQIQAAIGTVGTLAPHVESGRLRALAVIGPNRLPQLPNVPTMTEAGFPEAEFKPFAAYVLMAPAGTPAPILTRLGDDARAAIQTPAIKARFQAYGCVGMGNSAEAFRRDLDASGPVIEKLVKVSGAKVD